jgi:hypothetical protein
MKMMCSVRTSVRPLAFVILAALLVSCTRAATPEEVALAYGRALYANDADALWQLISTEDRRAKNEETFRRQLDLRGFARRAVGQLATYITAAPTKTSMTANRTTVTLRFRLPDANAAEVRALMYDWDEDRLDKLSNEEQARITVGLEALHRQGTLPVIEGEETIELVRDAGSWKVFLDWAAGVQVRFGAAVAPGVPLRVTVSPSEITLSPGERVKVTIHARNTGATGVTTRVGHRIEPDADAKHLALLLCPLFVPVTVANGETRDFTSEYMLVADAPKTLRSLDVVYVVSGDP